uniref:Ubiquitin-like protease family profile domain-containing protein n=1 Tax=viral metagenome TaxID=1070528 RepID=A0A6C0EXV0_9ZZZZ
MKSKKIQSILEFAKNASFNRDSRYSRNSRDSRDNRGNRGKVNKKNKYRKNKTRVNKTRTSLSRSNKPVSRNRKTKKNLHKHRVRRMRMRVDAINPSKHIRKSIAEDEGIQRHPDGFIKLKCSPKIQENDFTCYSNESLMKLKSLWNARHPDVVITSNEPREIWESLKGHLKNVCNKESCWLKQHFASTGVDKEMLNYTFAPKSPDDWKKNPNEWLNSIDIENVMKQYEREFPFFDFIGAAPIDFDSPKMYGECVWEELCHFDLNISIRNGKKKVGFVFNTDPHYLSGSHWISMFVDLPRKFIFFFDSTGNPPPKEVKRLIKTITQQAKTVGIDMRYIQNNKHHQKKPTECGMYALFMIINLLRDKMEPEDFIVDIFPDEEMQKFRHRYFNKDL